MTLLLCLALFWQLGHCYDEAEHAHVAWMMGKLGLCPLDDFFQHHMPLCWDVLKVYFQVGLDGPEVLYFGRFLVVLSLILSCFGWWKISHLLGPSKIQADYATAAGCGAFALLCLQQHDIMVIRPESLALAPWVLALWCWLAARTAPRHGTTLCFGSGVLYSISLFFSPRMLFLAAWVVYFGRRRPVVRHLLAFTVGGFAFALAYLACGSSSLRYLYFAVVYSSKLQKIGNWDTEFWMPYFYNPVVVTLAILWVLLLCMSTWAWRRLSCWHFIYLCVIYWVGWATSFPHLYLQNFVPCYLSLATSIVVLASFARWQDLPGVRLLIQLWLAGICGCSLLQLSVDVSRDTTIFHHVGLRHRSLRELDPATDTVMMCYQLHPIVVRDASYYGPWLGDAPNRMGDAVATVQDRFGLPPCDYFKDLKELRPKMIDTDLDLALHENEASELRAYIISHYQSVLWSRGNFPSVLLRKTPE